MSEKGWICIGTTLDGQPLYFNPQKREYVVETSANKVKKVTSAELIRQSKKRRSAVKQIAAS